MQTRRYYETIWFICFWGAGIFVLCLLLAILGLLIWRGGGILTWEFITSAPEGLFLGTEGGIFPAIAGTLGLTAIATLAAVIPALLTAIYLVEYGRGSKLGKFTNFVMQAMVGIPSILTGLFGYAFLVVYLDFGISLIAGGLTLSVMILPTLAIFMRDALANVDEEYRFLGESLGVSRRYLLRRVILPQAGPHLLSSVLLAAGYAAGATAPIMVTAAVIMSRGSLGLFSPVMALPFHIYILFSQHISVERAYGTALILVWILLVFNILSLYLRSRYGKGGASL